MLLLIYFTDEYFPLLERRQPIYTPFLRSQLNVLFSTIGKGSSKFFLPGATAAVLAMLGALHARRMYDDKKVSHAFVRFTYSIKYQLHYN